MLIQLDSVVVIQPNDPSIDWIQLVQIAIAILGFGGTIYTLYSGFRSFRRAEEWKKGEFVAKEIKEFLGDPVVQNALKIIDWGDRYVNLFLIPGAKRDDEVKVTREMQWRALVPDPLKPKYLDPTVEERLIAENQQSQKIFTHEEARVRDTYDALLFYFDRFYHFIETGLIKPDDIKPYLRYWMKSIADETHLPEDVAWRCALISFIWYYDYQGAIRLFEALGRPIYRDAPCWISLSKLATDQPYFADFDRYVGLKPVPKPS